MLAKLEVQMTYDVVNTQDTSKQTTQSQHRAIMISHMYIHLMQDMHGLRKYTASQKKKKRNQFTYPSSANYFMFLFCSAGCLASLPRHPNNHAGNIFPLVHTLFSALPW